MRMKVGTKSSLYNNINDFFMYFSWRLIGLLTFKKIERVGHLYVIVNRYKQEQEEWLSITFFCLICYTIRMMPYMLHNKNDKPLYVWLMHIIALSPLKLVHLSSIIIDLITGVSINTYVNLFLFPNSTSKLHQISPLYVSMVVFCNFNFSFLPCSV